MNVINIITKQVLVLFYTQKYVGHTSANIFYILRCTIHIVCYACVAPNFRSIDYLQRQPNTVDHLQLDRLHPGRKSNRLRLRRCPTWCQVDFLRPTTCLLLTEIQFVFFFLNFNANYICFNLNMFLMIFSPHPGLHQDINIHVF